MAHIDLERLVSAGALDHKFRELLLHDPIRAADGYYLDRFGLTSEEKAVLSSIHTSDFQTFVETVADWITHKRAGNGRRFNSQRF